MSVTVGIAALAAVLVVAAYVVGESESDPVSARADQGGDEASATPSPKARPDPPWLLPDMRSMDARAFQIVGSGDDRRIRFAAWLANDGPGPLLLQPRPGPGCPPGQRAAVQVLHFDTAGDDVFQRRADPARQRVPVGCMLDHPTHDHWHFDAMARYALLPVDGSEPLAEQNKVSFCLRDNTRVPGSESLQRKEYYGECERDSPQGISPGWVDVYDVDTPGQSLRLPPGTPDGVYCLTLEADPRGLLRETDETDNATAVPVRITGTNARRADTSACQDLV
jgi:hypothetical protein